MLLGRSLKETIPHFKPANGGGWISAVLAPGCGGTGHSLNYEIILFLFFKIGLFVENKYVTFELHNSFLSVIFLFERRGGAREKRDQAEVGGGRSSRPGTRRDSQMNCPIYTTFWRRDEIGLHVEELGTNSELFPETRDFTREVFCSCPIEVIL